MKSTPQDIGQSVQTLPANSSLWQGICRCVAVLCVALSVSLLTSPAAEANPRYASIIIEESSGKVLYSRNADKQLYPASLTKIMTLSLIHI